MRRRGSAPPRPKPARRWPPTRGVDRFRRVARRGGEGLGQERARSSGLRPMGLGEDTMGGSMRRSGLALTSFVLIAGIGQVRPAVGADDPARAPAQVAEKAKDQGRAAAAGAAAKPSDWRSELSKFFNQPGDDPPRPSLPLRPATVEDRRRQEATRLYTAARGLEDRGLWTDAVALLQEALKLDPDSVAIARRLSKIYIGALGRPDLGNQYGRRVLALEPENTETL